MNQYIKTAAEELKNKVMNEFKDVKSERNKHAESVIRSHVIFSTGAGAIPVMIVDVLAVSASQLDMIRQLAKIYEIDFSEHQGKSIVSALTTSTLAKIGAGSLVKLIPVVGSFIGGIANAILAGASTYALGQVFKLHFETGGTILDFDTKRLKKVYDEQFEKGKKVAEELRQQKNAKRKADEAAAASDSPDRVWGADEPVNGKQHVEPTAAKPAENLNATALSKLKELGELKNAGIITEEEFERMKKKVIEGF